MFQRHPNTISSFSTANAESNNVRKPSGAYVIWSSDIVLCWVCVAVCIKRKWAAFNHISKWGKTRLSRNTSYMDSRKQFSNYCIHIKNDFGKTLFPFLLCLSFLFFRLWVRCSGFFLQFHIQETYSSIVSPVINLERFFFKIYANHSHRHR